MTLGTAGAVALAAMIIIILPVAALPLAAFIQSSKLRLAWFVVGGMLVFQQSDAVGAPKLTYLAGAVLVAALSTVRVVKSDAPWLRLFRPALPTTAVLVALLAASYLVSTSAGITPTNWVRDAFPYLLLTLAPVIALDAAHDISEADAARLTAGCGLLAAVGFAADWLERRGVTALPFGRILLGSGCLAALAMSTALAKAAAGTHVLRWSALGLFVPAVMLTTGTRSIAAFAAAMIGAVGSRRNGRIGIARAALAGVVIGAALVLLVPRLVSVAVADPAWFDSRIQAATTVLNGGGQADGSYAERSISYEYAMEAWSSHPWLGTGPGFMYPGGGFTLDSPMLTPAKFGLVGAGILLTFLGSLMICSRRSSKRFGVRPAHTAIRAFAFVMVAFLPFGTPVEDKGFAFAIALALTAVGAAAATAVKFEVADPIGEEPAASVVRRAVAR